MSPERFRISEYRELWTPDDLEAGEPSERWTERDSVPATLRDVVEAFRECSELSCSPVDRFLQDDHVYAGRIVWGCLPDSEDYRTGEHETGSIHVTTIDGNDVTARILRRVLKLAGHVR
jgi:hypothetical protein